MLKIKFSGFYNNGLKKEKNYAFYNGGNGIFFFLEVLKFIFGNSNFVSAYFYKKNKYNLCFIKSNIRYKVSKHLINRICNRYALYIIFDSVIGSNDFVNGLKCVSAFSSVYINSNYVRLNKNIKLTNYFKLLGV